MANCVQTEWLSNTDYMLQFHRKMSRLHIPLSGSIELNYRCNLRCVHCYLGEQATYHEQRNLEMSTEQVISIIDDITEAGCLYLLITGGDPLIRKDFSHIYRHVKMNGLFVTVFTNGTLITEQILKLFDELPPYTVEITLYGATATTYEKITGIEGSFERCIKGINSLLAHNVKLKLKTILMTYNSHELSDMQDMAKELGVDFRFDAAISACFNGNKTPTTLRLPPAEVVAAEFAGPNKAQQWQELFTSYKAVPEQDTLYNCGAGLSSFHIDPYGNLQPCLMTHSLQYDLLQGDFLTGWHEKMPLIRERKAGASYACNQCDKRVLCNFCPPLSEMENGAEDIPSEYICEITHHRFQAINNHILKGTKNGI